MNVLSLFDGISTGRLALEMAGVKVDRYMASEIERAHMEISAANWPDIVQLGDVKHIKAADLPKIDLVIGGSPCQGFSRAGRHLNFDDPRSALFFEFSRIVAELRGRNPGLLFMLENVKMKKEWEAVITDTMRVQPLHINSSLVSAQNRPRTYWTNIPGVTPPEDRHIKLGDILEPNIDTGGYIAENGLLFDPSISQKARQLVTSENGEVRIKQATRQGYYRGGGRRRDKPGFPHLQNTARQGHKRKIQHAGLCLRGPSVEKWNCSPLHRHGVGTPADPAGRLHQKGRRYKGRTDQGYRERLDGCRYR